jgi:hypothetical protein
MKLELLTNQKYLIEILAGKEQKQRRQLFEDSDKVLKALKLKK